MVARLNAAALLCLAETDFHQKKLLIVCIRHDIIHIL